MTDGGDWQRVPGAQRPTTFIPVDPPAEVGGFLFAETADGVNPDGTPKVSPGRGWVTDPAERERLLGYLTSGPMVVETNRRSADRIDPSRQFAVPVSFRTDGLWVWHAAVEYYLRWHNIAPEPALYQRIVEHDYVCAPVGPEVLDRARAATYRRSDIFDQRVAEYRAAHPEPAPDDPTRFPPEVARTLTNMGWHPGRDVRERVDSWLAGYLDELAELPFERDGYPRYEPIPAALRALYEFGGLRSLASGRGLTSAQIPFTIYPGPDDDLTLFAVDAQLLGERIGERVFQIGDVERRMGALVVDEPGRVFAVGPVELYLGKDIDEALTRMLQGIRAEQLHEIGL